MNFKACAISHNKWIKERNIQILNIHGEKNSGRKIMVVTVSFEEKVWKLRQLTNRPEKLRASELQKYEKCKKSALLFLELEPCALSASTSSS